MKKLMSLLLALAMIVSLAACGAQDSASSQGETSDKGSTTETSSKWPEKETRSFSPGVLAAVRTSLPGRSHRTATRSWAFP